MAENTNTDHLPGDEKVINGSPTKKFFIDMLTRDITVSDAIGDLVDNAVDAARSEIYYNAGNTPLDLFSLRYDSTRIKISVENDQFIIEDNAGGIPYETARDYAFCFGRPEDFNGTPGSIGQFGIGMKRAFFKLGKTITIQSSTPTKFFTIEINVEEWSKKEEWDFEFKEVKECDITNGYGTKITVKNLNPDTKNLFSEVTYRNGLKQEIEIENWSNISKGMEIFINSSKLVAKDISMIEDESIGLKIGRWQQKFGAVDVRILCGVGEKGKKEDGGWYIFCNDRMILASDQTEVTGWTGGGRKVQGGPEYHSQYERFRGFVFFESQSPSEFPWNTAKTGLNSEHTLYLLVKAKMIDMMKDVNFFLNQLKDEKTGKGRGSNQPLSPTERKLDVAITVSLKDVALQTLVTQKFTAPETVKVVKARPNTVRISYDVELERFNSVTNILNTDDPKEVGQKTFDYFIENEI